MSVYVYADCGCLGKRSLPHLSQGLRRKRGSVYAETARTSGHEEIELLSRAGVCNLSRVDVRRWSCAFVACVLSLTPVACLEPPSNTLGPSPQLGQDAGRPDSNDGGDNDGGLNSQDAGLDAGLGETEGLVVCPLGSNADDCRFFGAVGIQQAADVAAMGNIGEPTQILVRQGSYSYPTLADFPGATTLTAERYFLRVNNKHLSFETDGVVLIDGSGSIPMHGVSIAGGSVSMHHWHLVGLHPHQLDTCLVEPNTDGCGAGGTAFFFTNDGVFNLRDVLVKDGRTALVARSTAKVFVTRSRFEEQWREGLLAMNQAEISVMDTYLVRMRNCLYLTGFAQGDAMNNTFYGCKVAGVNSYSCGSDHQPHLTFVNNIVTHTVRNTDGTFGFGIGGSCLDEDAANYSAAYNLFFANEATMDCVLPELCPGATTLVADPLYVDAAAGNFSVQSNSPAVDSGDPARTDADGSRSDRGVRPL